MAFGHEDFPQAEEVQKAISQTSKLYVESHWVDISSGVQSVSIASVGLIGEDVYCLALVDPLEKNCLEAWVSLSETDKETLTFLPKPLFFHSR